jgi:large subunit ribosomal protein L30
LNENSTELKCYAAIKIRGSISAQRQARETLELLRLTKNNYGVLVESSPSMIGMLRRIQSYVTWGEISNDTIGAMLLKRGRLSGDKKLTEEYAQKAGYKSLSELAAAIGSCKVAYRDLQGVQPVFKLHPPKRGFKGKTKKSFRAGGEAGYRGEAINDLVTRMI